MNIKKRFFLVILINLLLGLSCINIFIRSPFDKKDSDEVRICFWTLPGLRNTNLNDPNISVYIKKFLGSCDIFSILEVPGNEEMAIFFEKSRDFERYGFLCLEGNPKPKTGNGAKSLVCVKGEYADDIEKIEFEEYMPPFENSPTLYLINVTEKKIILIPFHARPGRKIDLKNLQSALEFSSKNFSDRRLFLGGSLYLDKKYTSIEFLLGLSFFLLLENKIESITTFSNEKNDSIFTDSRTSAGCRGKVWNLQEIFEERNYKGDFERISEHFPVSVDCIFK